MAAPDFIYKKKPPRLRERRGVFFWRGGGYSFALDAGTRERSLELSNCAIRVYLRFRALSNSQFPDRFTRAVIADRILLDAISQKHFPVSEAHEIGFWNFFLPIRSDERSGRIVERRTGVQEVDHRLVTTTALRRQGFLKPLGNVASV